MFRISPMLAGGAQACVDSRQHSLAVTLCHPWSFTSGSFLNRFFFPKACFRLKWNSMGLICSVSQWLMLQCYSWCGRGWKWKHFDKRSRSSRCLFFFHYFFHFWLTPTALQSWTCLHCTGTVASAVAHHFSEPVCTRRTRKRCSWQNKRVWKQVGHVNHL